ncbi:hypothetical protein [Xenorhabdus sp. SGI240]|uniref:hypothetical protein n=1 Tax=Xenorhabdus sp. SGI240 TaxID=3158262 RepID=UPI0032B70CCF
MSISYTWSFGRCFAQEFKNFDELQQNKILDFIEIYETNGLSMGSLSCYPGKVTYSWKNLDINDPNYRYTKDNNLWHYHIGLPEYVTRHNKYSTSDWVLHFQWKEGSSHISIVDVYSHYTKDGKFYLPPEKYLQVSTDVQPASID